MTPGGFVFDIHRYVPSGFASLIKAGEAGMSAARACPKLPVEHSSGAELSG
jgi:hypothetical protein